MILRLQRTAQDYRDPLDQQTLETLLMALTRVTDTRPGFLSDNPTLLADPMPELRSVLRDPGRVGTVAFNLQAMLAASHAVRDRLSQDTWRVIGNIRARLAEGGDGDPGPELDEAITLLAAVRGLQDDTMVHSQAWGFLELGRCVERGLLTSSLLRATMSTPRETRLESRVLEAVLSHLESVNAYRRQNHQVAQARPVLDLVLLHERNPRAVGYQLARLKAALQAMSTSARESSLSQEERLILEAHTALQLSDADKLAATDSDGDRRTELDQLLARTWRLLDRTARTLAESYFTDPRGPRQLTAANTELQETR